MMDPAYVLLGLPASFVLLTIWSAHDEEPGEEGATS